MAIDIDTGNRSPALCYFKWEGSDTKVLPWWILGGMSIIPPNRGAVEVDGEMTLFVYSSNGRKSIAKVGDWVLRLENGSLISLCDEDFFCAKSSLGVVLMERPSE